jgi:hypothetical protein
VPATASTAPGCARPGRPHAENTRPRLDRCSAHRIRPDRSHRPRSRPVFGPPLRQLASDPFHPVEGGCANDYVYTFGDPINTFDLDGLASRKEERCKKLGEDLSRQRLRHLQRVREYYDDVLSLDERGRRSHLKAIGEAQNAVTKAYKAYKKAGCGGPPTPPPIPLIPPKGSGGSSRERESQGGERVQFGWPPGFSTIGSGQLRD